MATWTSLVLIAALAVSTLSLPFPDESAYKIPRVGTGRRSQYFVQHNDGTYKFGHDTGEGAFESARLHSAGDLDGEFGYKDPEGQDIHVQYQSGVSGFRAQGAHLPAPHPDFEAAHAEARNRRPFVDPLADSDTDASYNFRFDGEEQSRTEVSDSDGNVRGSYTYTDEDGITRTYSYTAGPGIGFVIEGDDLPQQVDSDATPAATRLTSSASRRRFSSSSSSSSGRRPSGASTFSASTGSASSRRPSTSTTSHFGSRVASTSHSGQSTYRAPSTSFQAPSAPRRQSTFTSTSTASRTPSTFSSTSTGSRRPSSTFTSTSTASRTPSTFSSTSIGSRRPSTFTSTSSGSQRPSTFSAAGSRAPSTFSSSSFGSSSSSSSSSHRGATFRPTSTVAQTRLSSRPFEEANTRSEVRPDGSYAFAYETSSHSRSEGGDSDNNVVGKFEFEAEDDGVEREIEYEAGSATGFIAEGAHIPVGPEVPGAPSGQPTGRIVPVQEIPFVDPLADTGLDASYNFAFNSDEYSRSETADEDGNVVGTYTVVDEDGTRRTYRFRAGKGIGYETEEISVSRGPVPARVASASSSSRGTSSFGTVGSSSGTSSFGTVGSSSGTSSFGTVGSSSHSSGTRGSASTGGVVSYQAPTSVRRTQTSHSRPSTSSTFSSSSTSSSSTSGSRRNPLKSVFTPSSTQEVFPGFTLHQYDFTNNPEKFGYVLNFD